MDRVDVLGNSKEIADQVDDSEFAFDVSEIDDFDITPPSYQVWVIGYDEHQSILDYDSLIESFDDPDAAIECAKQFIIEEKFKNLQIPDDVHFLSIEVETVVTDSGYDENVGTIFQDGIKLK